MVQDRTFLHIISLKSLLPSSICANLRHINQLMPKFRGISFHKVWTQKPELSKIHLSSIYFHIKGSLAVSEFFSATLVILRWLEHLLCTKLQ
uniref:2-dehydro-3-deoxyphosphooctonate aldolase-like n=1 Tax=Rhizophora mucronata TaxID=61149 RepID=A0A2P2JLA2_RHIMU